MPHMEEQTPGESKAVLCGGAGMQGIPPREAAHGHSRAKAG
jgi:hypothetical protein